MAARPCWLPCAAAKSGTSDRQAATQNVCRKLIPPKQRRGGPVDPIRSNPDAISTSAPVTDQTRSSIRDWLSEADLGKGRYLFPSRFRAQPHLSTRRAVQLLLGHTKLESTDRYLGIEVDDALSIAEQVEL